MSEDLESRLSAAQDEIGRLKASVRDSERDLARILTLVSQHQNLLNTHQSSIVRLDRAFTDVTGGRLWRSLRAVGSLVKRFMPGEQPASAIEERKNIYLRCDEPLPNDTTFRSGTARIRGWALAEGGVESLRLEIAGLETQTTVPNQLRPDVKKSFPDLDPTGRSGYMFEVNTLALPNGRHPFTVRMRAQGEDVSTLNGFFEIDHEKGFASEYDRWIKEFEAPDSELMGIKVKGLSHQPLFSILMPTFNTKPEELTAVLDSVMEQSYAKWELCIADDASSKPEVREILESTIQDPRARGRIKVVYRSERGGISRACNTARELATGEYFCFLDHDDLLSKQALAYICEAINRAPNADLLYSDEDKIDEAGHRGHPFFKPDWSPDTLLTVNYICHFLVVERTLAEAVGGLNPECDGAQDYDFILRASALVKHVEHIPRVLYHWRASAVSTATTMDNKSFALEAQVLALRRHAKNSTRIKAIFEGTIAGCWRTRYAIPEGTKVSIIIASGGKAGVLRTNLDSLFEKTTYRDYEVVIADNSKGTLIQALTSEYAASHPNLRYFDWRDKPFNFSTINNAAARTCKSQVLLFLNDDTSVIEPGWLESMVELAARPEVGAVGAKLLYPTGGIQHGGVVMGIYDNCGHAFKMLDGAVPHYFHFTDIVRNVSAVTGACLMARAEVFWQVGGFDELEFAVAFNDIDLCLKIGKAGYRVLYTPYALLYHHEAFSKTSKDLIPHPDEVAAMQAKWTKVIAHDPFYNPNLTRNDENYTLRSRG